MNSAHVTCSVLSMAVRALPKIDTDLRVADRARLRRDVLGDRLLGTATVTGLLAGRCFLDYQCDLLG